MAAEPPPIHASSTGLAILLVLGLLALAGLSLAIGR